MSFVGITFDGQNVSPKDDGVLYATLYGDGIIDGCSMTIGGNNDTLVIQSGHIIACGRVCKVDGATELYMDSISQNYVQVYLQYDVSQAEGHQWDWGYNQSNSIDGLPTLTQEDINGTDNIYQVQLAILEASNSSLTSITRHLGTSPLQALRTLFNCDLIIDKGSGQGGYYYSYQDGVVKGRVGYGTDDIYRVGTVNGTSSLGGLLVPTDINSAVKIFGNNQDIHLMPLGVVDYGIDYAIGKSSGMIVCSNDASHVGGLRRSYGGNVVSYLQQTYTGYMDLWSKQNIQIRCGAGNEQNDNVRFLFGTTGVLIAKGMYATTRSGSTLVIDSNGAIGRTSSLRKYKKNIEDVTEEQADKGYELRPITYVSAIEDDIKERQFGFIAEEVEEVIPELCTYDLDGNVDGVAYERICSLLLKQNQLLKARVDELEKRVEKLEAK